jgi:hypothetical protein
MKLNAHVHLKYISQIAVNIENILVGRLSLCLYECMLNFTCVCEYPKYRYTVL